MLPPNDAEYLLGREIDHTVTAESNMTCVVLRDFALPPGLDRPTADLLVRLHPGYPDVPPDMWWFDPPVRRADGRPIPATDGVEQYLGRRWQRWSRHLSGGQWRSGIDGLESFLALIRKELTQAAAAIAA